MSRYLPDRRKGQSLGPARHHGNIHRLARQWDKRYLFRDGSGEQSRSTSAKGKGNSWHGARSEEGRSKVCGVLYLTPS